MVAPGPLDDWICALEQRLLGGLLSDAMAVLQSFAAQGHAHQVLTPLLVETIRRLEIRWRENQISTGDVTLAFSTARHLIASWQTARRSSLQPLAQTHPSLRVLVGVAPGDSHTFGAQILSDDLGLRGWSVDTRLDAPAATLVRDIGQRPYAAVMLSVGQDGSLAGVGDLIAELRSVSVSRGLLILVGGSGLAEPFSQYHFLGADLVAGTAAEGAEFLASRLTQGLPYTRN